MKNNKIFSGIFVLTSVLTSCSVWSSTVNVDLNKTYQAIDGFGGMNAPGWIADLTSSQAKTAFGTGSGELGLSIMRMRIDPDSNNWSKQVPIAQYAASKHVKLLATPWTPPAYMKDNNSLKNGGKLKSNHYHGYTQHLNKFVSYMKSKNAAIYALSIQNEPDWQPDYESCEWSGSDFVNYLKAEGKNLDNSVKIVAPESLNFNHKLSDPFLNNSQTAKYVDIVGGHLYGKEAFDYPLARQKGKKLWMTEHFTTNDDANNWSKALSVGTELHKSMVSNYSGYIWWYIRRSYGLLTDNGKVSKRGYIMSQYSKFIRPGFERVSATEKPASGVYVTAYKNNSGKVVVVAVNTTSSQQKLDFKLNHDSVKSLVKYSTSEKLNVGYGGTYKLNSHKTTAYVDPKSVTTFVSE
ncbi:Glucuronoxylanase XynC precursor [Vibrio aerogenes CECT 7868]|uniref:Glucuronoxylanase XynC n=1 Tax=Vibrio aerogenes CECT 7868 TaxID=1216006 RepID=A0A1M5XW15_9VIBR|nr:glycoside hydrolase family 30 beta sandwich domain-containing protein [Vibrio aerogenes]SHI03453.1 Glucuronoxylanase XynC precursor [Vibrio aerogenes CECT 7868]